MPFERIYNVRVEESNLLNAIQSKECKKEDIVSFYADAIKAEGGARAAGREDRISWMNINTAIVLRWSQRALIEIKRKAWKLVEGQYP